MSKDENLTKSHVKFLESTAIQIALQTKRYKLENYNQPQLSSLPPSDRDAMKEFLIYIKLLLGVLGHRTLEEVTTKIVNESQDNSRQIGMVEENRAVNNDTKPQVSIRLFLNVSGLKASAITTDEGIVVLKGSDAAFDIKESLSDGYRLLREKLKSNGTLVVENNKFKFDKEQLFRTASQAANVIVGYSINGREHWKDISGRSLKNIEEQI